MFRASLKSTGYLFVADNIDLSSLSFYDSALQKATYSKVVHNGRSRSFKVIQIGTNKPCAISYYYYYYYY